jgi:hypothetical protein
MKNRFWDNVDWRFQFSLDCILSLKLTTRILQQPAKSTGLANKTKERSFEWKWVDSLTLTPGAGARSLIVNPSSAACPFFSRIWQLCSRCARSCNFSTGLCSTNEARLQPSCAVQQFFRQFARLSVADHSFTIDISISKLITSNHG